MCSLSIVDTPELRVVTMNRDEAISRAEGTALHLDSGPAQASFPIDQKAGGTWFAANRYGIAAALLNRYQGPQRLAQSSRAQSSRAQSSRAQSSRAQSSRGAIIPELIRLADMTAIEKHLHALDCSRFNPFDLILVDISRVLVFSWPGVALAGAFVSTQGRFSSPIVPRFFTSSALRAEEALPARQRCFVQWLGADARNSAEPEAILRTLHWAESADPGIGIRMQRAQSHTKSICQLTLRRSADGNGTPQASSTMHNAALTLRYWNSAALNKLEHGNAGELAQTHHWFANANAA